MAKFGLISGAKVMRRSFAHAWKLLSVCLLPACAVSTVLDGVPDLLDGSSQPPPSSPAGGSNSDGPGDGKPPTQPASPSKPDAGGAHDAGPPGMDAAAPPVLVDATVPVQAATPDAAQTEQPDSAVSVPPTCAVGTSLCAGACVDLQSDASHCGSCDNRCAGVACSAGVCATASAPPAGCTAQSYGAHSYFFCSTKLDWIDARDACRMLKLDLTVVDDAAENTFVHGAGQSWIGASDIDGENQWRALKPGVASRAEGPIASYTNWASGQPDDTLHCAGTVVVGNGCLIPTATKTDEDCALMQTDGKWDDVQCPLLNPYVCESY